MEKVIVERAHITHVMREGRVLLSTSPTPISLVAREVIPHRAAVVNVLPVHTSLDHRANGNVEHARCTNIVPLSNVEEFIRQLPLHEPILTAVALPGSDGSIMTFISISVAEHIE
jgi:hypothetical protein